VEGNWNRPPTNFGLKVALAVHVLLHYTCAVCIIAVRVCCAVVDGG